MSSPRGMDTLAPPTHQRTNAHTHKSKAFIPSGISLDFALGTFQIIVNPPPPQKKRIMFIIIYPLHNHEEKGPTFTSYPYRIFHIEYWWNHLRYMKIPLAFCLTQNKDNAWWNIVYCTLPFNLYNLPPHLSSQPQTYNNIPKPSQMYLM